MIETVGWFSDDDGASTDLEVLAVDEPAAALPFALGPTQAAPAPLPQLPSPWGECDGGVAPPWPDCSVRRLVSAPLPEVAVAVAAACVARWSRRLTVSALHALAGDGEVRMPGALQFRRGARPVPVELVVATWNVGVTELRLELRARRRRLAIPDAYFDVAHTAMDALRDTVRVATSPGRRHLRLVS
jgi:hypothetical protein